MSNQNTEGLLSALGNFEQLLITQDDIVPADSFVVVQGHIADEYLINPHNLSANFYSDFEKVGYEVPIPEEHRSILTLRRKEAGSYLLGLLTSVSQIPRRTQSEVILSNTGDTSINTLYAITYKFDAQGVGSLCDDFVQDLHLKLAELVVKAPHVTEKINEARARKNAYKLRLETEILSPAEIKSLKKAIEAVKI